MASLVIPAASFFEISCGKSRQTEVKTLPRDCRQLAWVNQQSLLPYRSGGFSSSIMSDKVEQYFIEGKPPTLGTLSNVDVVLPSAVTGRITDLSPTAAVNWLVWSGPPSNTCFPRLTEWESAPKRHLNQFSRRCHVTKSLTCHPSQMRMDLPDLGSLAHKSQQPRLHLEQFSHSCTVHPCNQHTQTHRPRYVWHRWQQATSVLWMRYGLIIFAVLNTQIPIIPSFNMGHITKTMPHCGKLLMYRQGCNSQSNTQIWNAYLHPFRSRRAKIRNESRDTDDAPYHLLAVTCHWQFVQ